MGLQSPGTTEQAGKDRKIGSLVIEDVKVVEREIYVDRPVYKEVIIEVPKVKYVDEIVTVTKPKIIEETVRTQTVQVEEKTLQVERPVYTDITIERPVYKDVEVIRTTIKEQEKIIEIPRVIQKTKIIEEELVVKVPKLVEEVIRVPRIQYIPTEVERIVWKDVPRERCSHCNKEI